MKYKGGEMKSSIDVEQLIEELDRCRASVSKLIKELKSSREGEEWDAFALERNLEAAERAWSWGGDLGAMVAATRSRVELDAGRALLELEADVRGLCARRSWRVDGQWPRLYVERAIQIDVDEKRRSVSIGGAKLTRLGVRAIDRMLENEIKDLVPRDFEANQFMSQLSRAYDAATVGKGGEAPILRVYREMILLTQASSLWRDARAGSFKEFTSNQFRARLSASLESGVRSASDGRELRLLPPIDPKDAIFVYQPAERRFGFVGRIEFRSMEHGPL